MPGRALILWQEDEFLIRFTGTECLSDAGLDVVSVGDNEGVRRAVLSEARQEFDVIVLNGKLPDGKGTDVCAEIRTARIGVPILMQSGYGSIDHYREAMRAGITDYLEKPWLPSELVERVELLLEMPSTIRLQTRAATSRGSNLPPLQAYCFPVIESAMHRLSAVRPLEGTLPVHVPGVGDDERKDVRLVALDENVSDELLATLKAIENHLAHNADDVEERARLRAELMGPLNSVRSWLATRATVVTDEIIKKYAPIGLAAYVAHLYGLKIDLFHLLVALGLSPVGH